MVLANSLQAQKPNNNKNNKAPLKLRSGRPFPPINCPLFSWQGTVGGGPTGQWFYVYWFYFFFQAVPTSCHGSRHRQLPWTIGLTPGGGPSVWAASCGFFLADSWRSLWITFSLVSPLRRPYEKLLDPTTQLSGSQRSTSLSTTWRQFSEEEESDLSYCCYCQIKVFTVFCFFTKCS